MYICESNDNKDGMAFFLTFILLYFWARFGKQFVANYFCSDDLKLDNYSSIYSKDIVKRDKPTGDDQHIWNPPMEFPTGFCLSWSQKPRAPSPFWNNGGRAWASNDDPWEVKERQIRLTYQLGPA